MSALMLTEGSIEEALAIYSQTPEFDRVMTKQTFLNKLAERKHLILIVKDGSQDIGFKVGYEQSHRAFYSWLGSVLPAYRGRGVADRLRTMQEHWASEQGYTCIRVKSCNRFPAMLNLLIASGYKITGYDDLGDLSPNKIHFTKTLPYKT